MSKLYGKDNPYKQPQVNERVNRLGGTPSVDDLIYGEMPDGKTNPDGWKTRMRARLAPKIKRRTGLADRDNNLNVLLREIIAELDEIDEIGNIKMAVGIMRRRTKLYVKQRADAKAEKQRQADEKAEIYEYGRSLRMKDVHIAAVIAKITAGIDYAQRCHDALDAYRRDNPEPAKQDDAQRGYYETGTVPNTAGMATSIEEFAARERQRLAEAQRTTTDATNALDDTFGKKADKPPVINPGNWTHDSKKLRKFYADLNDKGWNKYGIPESDRSQHIHTALNVNSLHETNLSPDVTLVTVLVYLEKLFANKESDMAKTKLTAADWSAWLTQHGWKSADVLTILNNHCISNGEAPVTKLSEWPSDLGAAEMAVEAALDKKSAQKADNLNESEVAGQTIPEQSETPPQSNIASVEPTNVAAVPKALDADLFEIDPFLLEAKTLMGIPVMRMQEFINRKYEKWAYKTSRESFGEATIIDPLAVRQRFDKVFGPHGVGWRIIPVPHAAQTILTPFTQATKNGDRDMYSVTLSGYVMEYRVRIGDQVEWQRTSAFTDSNDNDDMGYAGGGAFTSLMKQALKMLGGYDHFIIPEKKKKVGQAA